MSTDSLTLLPRLAKQINEHHRKAETAMRAGLEHALAAGRLLAEAKTHRPHGTWGEWVSENCEFSQRTAQSYMRVVERWPEIEAKAQRVADLSFRDASRLLSSPPGGKAGPRLPGEPRLRGRLREAVALEIGKFVGRAETRGEQTLAEQAIPGALRMLAEEYA